MKLLFKEKIKRNLNNIYGTFNKTTERIDIFGIVYHIEILIVFPHRRRGRSSCRNPPTLIRLLV